MMRRIISVGLALFVAAITFALAASAQTYTNSLPLDVRLKPDTTPAAL